MASNLRVQDAEAMGYLFVLGKCHIAISAGLLLLSLLLPAGAAERALPAGKVVWWGKDPLGACRSYDPTNGLIFSGNDLVTNAVALAAGFSEALVLRADGSVVSLAPPSIGRTKMPPGLSNVVSVAVEGNSSWAIRRDGSVVQWGDDQDERNLVPSLSNVTQIAWAGLRSYLALRSDGTVMGLRISNADGWAYGVERPDLRPTRVRGQPVSNVVAIASGETPFIIKREGKVLRLSCENTDGLPPDSIEGRINPVTGEPSPPPALNPPFEYTTAEPVRVGVKPLVDALAIKSWGPKTLVLRRNGTVVDFGTELVTRPKENGGGFDLDFGPYYPVPAGLKSVVAIAPGLALKRDGTVIAWGGNPYGNRSVPAGLSNVIAIAANDQVSLAITTGSVPSSVSMVMGGRP